MFDTVSIHCPGCYEPLEVQSKAGTCELEIFDEKEMPADIANDLKGELITCHLCKRTWELALYDWKPTVPVFLKEVV